MLDVNVTLSNVNLLEHNITSIQIFGVDGNSEVITITDANTLLSGENNLFIFQVLRNAKNWSH